MLFEQLVAALLPPVRCRFEGVSLLHSGLDQRLELPQPPARALSSLLFIFKSLAEALRDTSEAFRFLPQGGVAFAEKVQLLDLGEEGLVLTLRSKVGLLDADLSLQERPGLLRRLLGCFGLPLPPRLLLSQELRHARGGVSLSAQKFHDLTLSRSFSLPRRRSLLKLLVGEFEARCKELVRQTELLHQQLQKTPAAGQTEGTAEGEVVEFLRGELDTAACEAELLRQEKTRWQRQSETAQKSAEEARALLQAEVSIKKANLASEGEHKALLAKVEQLNLLRESNATLRQEAERLAGVTKGLRQALEDKEKAGEGTGRRLRELEALVKARVQERDTLKAASDRWEKRCNQLLEKH